MQSVITVKLSDEVKKAVDQLSAEEGISPDEIVGLAIKQHIFLRKFRSLRERMTARARSQGGITDQDVFDQVS